MTWVYTLLAAALSVLRLTRTVRQRHVTAAEPLVIGIFRGGLQITDVQWVLGHAHLTTTEIYLTPDPDQLVERLLAHHARQAGTPAPARPAPGYRPEVLQTLFGGLPVSGEVTS